MAGFTTNNRTNNQIADDTGYVRAGQGGKRHRFAGKLNAGKPKAKNALDGLGDLGGMSDLSGMDNDGDPNADMMGGEGLLDHDINSAPTPPVAVHIHLSPSDHKAFKGMAGKKPSRKKY